MMMAHMLSQINRQHSLTFYLEGRELPVVQ